MNIKFIAKLNIAGIFIFGLLSGVILSGHVAHASSIYDDYYHDTPRLEVKSPGCNKDITTSWSSYLGSYSQSFQNALSNGTYGVSELPRYGLDANGNVEKKAVIVYWNESQRMNVNWMSWGYMVTSPSTSSVILEISSCNSGSPNISASYYGTGYVSSNDGVVANFFYNGDVTYPTGYEGQYIHSTSEWADLDGDGLIATQETAQGTSNSTKDTDGDGLDDFVESEWNPNRDDIFCGTQCAYPNPTIKDLYIEIDWMKDGNNRSFQPNSTQLGVVGYAYAQQGIDAHFDTGQYGGGNELPNYIEDLYFEPNASASDFFDYRNGTTTQSANFNTNRDGIWHYLISGYKYHEIPDSSGVSYTGSDASFVSTGLIMDGQPSFGYLNQDMAIAGTIIHELGHSVCLGNSRDYAEQSSGCIYANIDASSAPSTYVSSMNYNEQMFMANYSDGANGSPDDHDDWSAVKASLADFTNPNRRITTMNQGVKKRTVKKQSLTRGITIKEAREAKQKGVLGKASRKRWN